MTVKYLKSFNIDSFEYIVNLKKFDSGDISFFIKDDLQNFFEIFYSVDSNNFLCYKKQNDKKKLQIFDQDFILNHIRKFSTIFSNQEIFYQNENNFIEDDLNKLIIFNKDLMYFYDNKSDILYKVFKYKIVDVELIYQEKSLEKINFSQAQLGLNKIVKNNYDLLEVKLIKVDIDNLKNAIQNSSDDEELCCELEIELKKLSNEYLLKLSIARDRRNCSSLNNVFLKNMSQIKIVFNNSFSHKIASVIGHIFVIQNIFFKSNPNLFNLIFSRIANSILLPLNTLFFEISDLLTADYYYEKRFEINNQLESYSILINEFNSIAQNQCKKSFLTSLIFEFFDFILTYTIDISCYIMGEVYYFIKEPINKFKKYLFVI